MKDSDWTKVKRRIDPIWKKTTHISDADKRERVRLDIILFVKGTGKIWALSQRHLPADVPAGKGHYKLCRSDLDTRELCPCSNTCRKNHLPVNSVWETSGKRTNSRTIHRRKTSRLVSRGKDGFYASIPKSCLGRSNCYCRCETADSLAPMVTTL